jgi:hypothetical protein
MQIVPAHDRDAYEGIPNLPARLEQEATGNFEQAKGASVAEPFPNSRP